MINFGELIEDVLIDVAVDSVLPTRPLGGLLNAALSSVIDQMDDNNDRDGFWNE